MFFNESTFEQAVIELLQGLGYTHIYAPDLNREDFSDPLMESALIDSLVRINKKLPVEAIHEAIAKLRNFEGGSLVEKNKAVDKHRFHQRIRKILSIEIWCIDMGISHSLQ